MAMPRGSIMGWVAAALVAIGGVAAGVWATQEKSEAGVQLEEARETLDERRKELKDLKASADAKEEKAEALADSVQRCVDSISEQILAYGELEKRLRSSSAGEISELLEDAESLLERAKAALSCDVSSTESV